MEMRASHEPHEATEPNRPLIHIGLHKTGTTWLQKNVFGSGRFGFGHWNQELFERRKYKGVWEDYPPDFDAEKVREYFTDRLTTPAGVQPVISSEKFSGNPLFGGYDRYDIAHRLAKIFPEARVLICIREQRSIIRSSYFQFINAGGMIGLDDYISGRDTRGPSFRLDHFRYDVLLELYRSLFGAENVLVLAYEELRRYPLNYANRLLAFCKLRQIETFPVDLLDVVHKSASPTAVSVRRRLNLFMRRDYVNGFTPLGSDLGQHVGERICRAFDLGIFEASNRQISKAWDKIIEARTAGFFRESNIRTAELTGIDLRSFGYAMSSNDERSPNPSVTRNILGRN
jgi:hypothetical protein